MTSCSYTCLTPDGATCELEQGHEGPHRNGGLIWHDPPLLLVDGKPYVPPDDDSVPAEWSD